MPLLIVLAESQMQLPELADRVNDMLRRRGRCVLVVSEGLELASVGERRDSFGHVQFSSSETTVAQMVVNYLNGVGLRANGSARSNVPGTHQRHEAITGSTVDMAEAYAVGQKAALLAAAGETGYMATLLRNPGPIYSVRYDKVPLEQVANSERTFPPEWITGGGADVSDAFVAYARPLIGESWPSVPLVDGRQRFARLQPNFAPQHLSAYIPQAHRAR